MASSTLVTGATGYIGGRLVPRLLAAGHRVRVLVRGADSIKGRPWAEQVEVVRGDLLDAETLLPALEGVATAYYLVHSMTAGEGFEERDRAAARNFVAACRHGAMPTGPPHVVYLGGLQPAGEADLRPPLQPGGDRGAAGGRAARPRHRVPGRADHRLGVGQLRDDPLPHRAAPGDGHAQLGRHRGHAGGRPRRAGVPARGGAEGRGPRGSSTSAPTRCPSGS